MIDMNALITRLKAAGGSAEAVDQLVTALNSSGTAVGPLTPETRANIERAAAAMQSGDYQAAQDAAAQLMSTPDGARLTSTVLGMLGK